MTSVVRAGLLIDGTGAAPVRDAAVVVTEGKIAYAGEAKGLAQDMAIPEGTRALDLGDACLLPGLIDCHYHPALCPRRGYEVDQYAAPAAELALRAACNVQVSLRAGTTTVRVVAEKGLVDFHLIRAMETGFLFGPRILPSGPGITPTGGHGAIASVVADGEKEVRLAVRAGAEMGAKTIKLFISGGTGTLGTVVTRCYYSREEIHAAIEEAHRADLPVTAHLHGGAGFRWALEAGIDCVEHGAYLTQEDLDLMAEKGTWLVPTLATSFHEPCENDVPKPPEVVKKKMLARAARQKMVPMAMSAGVKIAAGTDSMHGQMAFELELLTRFGYTPMEAIVAGTSRAAELCRIQDLAGTLVAGKSADLFAVRGNPLDDIGALRDVVMVMKEGRLVTS